MLLVALCGGLGAVARFVVDGLIRGRVRSIGSIGTLIINVTGAIALGIIAGLVAAHVAQPDWQIVIGTGSLSDWGCCSSRSRWPARQADSPSGSRSSRPALRRWRFRIILEYEIRRPH